MKKIKIGKYEIRMKVAGDSISVRVHHFGSELPFVGTILYQTGKDTTDAEMWAISKINQDIEGKQEENVLSFHPRQDEQDEKETYFLLGGEGLISIYHTEPSAAIEACEEGEEFKLYKYTEGLNHPSNIVEETQGWGSYATLTKREYEQFEKIEIED